MQNGILKKNIDGANSPAVDEAIKASLAEDLDPTQSLRVRSHSKWHHIVAACRVLTMGVSRPTLSILMPMVVSQRPAPLLLHRKLWRILLQPQSPPAVRPRKQQNVRCQRGSSSSCWRRWRRKGQRLRWALQPELWDPRD